MFECVQTPQLCSSRACHTPAKVRIFLPASQVQIYSSSAIYHLQSTTMPLMHIVLFTLDQAKVEANPEVRCSTSDECVSSFLLFVSCGKHWTGQLV